MFLLTAESLKREKARQKSLNGTARAEEPEADALREIKRLEGLFRQIPAGQKLQYNVGNSIKGETSSGEYFRALGAATLRMSGLRPKPGYAGEGSWLIDGLAMNLLKEALQGLTITTAPSNGLKRTRSRVDFWELMELLSNSIQWGFIKPKAGIREREYLIRGEGIEERLIFLGHSVRSRLSTGMISGVKMSGRGKPRSLAGANLKRALNEIFEDQKRRVTLSYEYESSTEAHGLPAPLRAEIKRVLEAAGIPNGSYSREGFSSGRFPYRYTHAPIRNSSAALLFSRCNRCRTVNRLSIENGSYDEIRAAWELTEEHIAPWHERVCGTERLTTAIVIRTSFTDQPWELKWLTTVA